MADINFGSGPNTATGDLVSVALQKLQARIAVIEANPTPTPLPTPAPAPDPAAISWSSAALIGHQTGPVADSSPAAVMRKTFTPAKPVASATLQATALGTYIAFVNGQRVGDHELAPGWTDYGKRRQFQTYDVTSLLIAGVNAVGVEVGDGWAHGFMSLRGRNYYGADVPRAMVALRLNYTDGTSQTIVSDGTWKANTSDNVKNDWYKGSTHDARLRKDWSNPATSDAAWPAVTAASAGGVPLVKQPCPPARRVETRFPIARTSPSAGVYIFDFGENHVGYCTLNVTGAVAGQQITLRHAEDLKIDGSGTLYTANLRAADATDRFISAGAATETFEPRHTYHGYRYVEVTGYPGLPPLRCITSHFIYNDAPTVSKFNSSSGVLKRIWDAALVTWKGNALTLPTDCPQRDERLGWSADAHLFVEASTYLQNTPSFWNKYCYDLDDSQVNGQFGDVAPYVADVGRGSAGWGEAGIIIPWVLYRRYGNTTYLSEHWEAMKAALPMLPYANVYNDYLNLNQPTSPDVFRYAFAFYAADIMRQAATVLGDNATITSATNAMNSFRATWLNFVSNSGSNIGNNSQTSFILGVAFGILPANNVGNAVARLVSLINSEGLKCGFVGLAYLFDVLADNGHLALAYQLAEKATDPSNGFMLASGLTTLGEQWNPRALQGVNDVANSYNHYVRGAVVSWIARTVAGIDTSDPGYATMLLRPRPGGGATSASLSFDSPKGAIHTDWQVRGDTFAWSFTVPTGAVAIVVLPHGYEPAGSPPGSTSLPADTVTGGRRWSVPAGNYSITAASSSSYVESGYVQDGYVGA